MIIRSRLVNAIASAEGPVFIEAGGGTGKTVLANQLAEQLPGAVSSISGRSAEAFQLLSDVVGNDALIVDDAHLLPPPAGQLLLDRLGESSAPTVIIGRLLDPAFDVHRLTEQRCLFLDSSALFFDKAELLELIQDEAAVVAAQRLTAGWPIAISAMLESSGSDDPKTRTLSRRTTVVDAVLASYLDVSEDVHFETSLTSSRPVDWTPLVQLGYVRSFTTEIARELDPDLIESAKRSGVPLVRLSVDRYELPLPVRHALRRAIDIPVEKLEPIVSAFVAHNEIEAALDVCAQSGWVDRAAEVLSGMNPDQIYSVDPERLPAILAVLGSEIRNRPQAMLAIARIQLMSGEVEDVRRSLEAALERLRQVDPDTADPLHHEVLAELAFLEYEASNFKAAAELRDFCAAVIATDETTAANARLKETTAGLLAREKTRTDLFEARELLVDAMNIWRRLGYTTRAGMTERVMVWLVLFELGHYEEVVTLLDRALSTGGTTSIETAMNQLFRARALGFLGRREESLAALEQVDELAVSLELDWIRGYANWVGAINASYGGSGEPGVADEVMAMVGRAEELLGPLTSGSSGAVFRCEAAIALARCGLHSSAVAELNQARQTDGADPFDIAKAAASIEARGGDAEVAVVLLNEWRNEHPLSPVDTWTADTLQAYAHHRLGQAERAVEQLAQARSGINQTGHPDVLVNVESDLVDVLVEQARTDQENAVGTIDLRLFGSFAVHVEGADVGLTKGHGQTLLKLLVLRQGRLHLDEAIDVLWPDADLALGRRRLRNVMQRLRTICGPIVERNDEFLRLRPDVTADFWRARERIDRLLRETNPALGDLVATSRLLRDELLAADRFEEWADLARTVMQQDRLRILDRLADSALKAGEPEQAVETLEIAIELDPFGTTRVNQAVELLNQMGNKNAARLLRQRVERRLSEAES